MGNRRRGRVAAEHLRVGVYDVGVVAERRRRRGRPGRCRRHPGRLERPCHEPGRHRLGDRHADEHRRRCGDRRRGWPGCDRDHPGRLARLCHELERQHRLDHRHADEHRCRKADPRRDQSECDRNHPRRQARLCRKRHRQLRLDHRHTGEHLAAVHPDPQCAPNAIAITPDGTRRTSRSPERQRTTASWSSTRRRTRSSAARSGSKSTLSAIAITDHAAAGGCSAITQEASVSGTSRAQRRSRRAPSHDDVILGTDGQDLIRAGGGDDVVCGIGGAIGSSRPRRGRDSRSRRQPTRFSAEPATTASSARRQGLARRRRRRRSPPRRRWCRHLLRARRRRSPPRLRALDLRRHRPFPPIALSASRYAAEVRCWALRRRAALGRAGIS